MYQVKLHFYTNFLNSIYRVLRIYYLCGMLRYRFNFWNGCTTIFHLIQFNWSLLQQLNFICEYLSSSTEKKSYDKLKAKNKCTKAVTAKMWRLSEKYLNVWQQKILDKKSNWQKVQRQEIWRWSHWRVRRRINCRYKTWRWKV